jgi:hypothetical protein
MSPVVFKIASMLSFFIAGVIISRLHAETTIIPRLHRRIDQLQTLCWGTKRNLQEKTDPPTNDDHSN